MRMVMESDDKTEESDEVLDHVDATQMGLPRNARGKKISRSWNSKYRKKKRQLRK